MTQLHDGHWICSRIAAGAAMLALVVLLLPGRARAQVNTADVVGTVTDTTGAVVPGATVTLKNTGTGVARATQTSDDGNFIFNLVQVGTYDLTIEAKGFKAQATRGVNLSAGDRVRYDGKLEVGAASETVAVNAADAPALQTDSSSMGAVVPTRTVSELPLNGRDLYNLVQLSPGVNEGAPNATANGTRTIDRRMTSAYSANGQNTFMSNNIIDGMDNNERSQGTVVIKPSIDAIQEVKVNTNVFPAEMGRTEGAVVDIITKSGTNAYHGSLFEYIRNDVEDARNFFTPATQNKPELRQNQFGGSLGGPIKKNKTFFFGDYEGFRQIAGQTMSARVPTLVEEQLVANATVGSTITIDDPMTSSSATYTVPVSALGKNLFAMYPAPTNDNAGKLNNFVFAPTRNQFSTTMDGRVDQHFSDRDTLFGRYSINDVTTIVPGFLPTQTIGGVVYGDAGGNNNPGTSKIRAQGLALSYVHVFKSNLVLEAKAGYLRYANQSVPINGQDYATKIGFASCLGGTGTGFCVSNTFPGQSIGLPGISPKNYQGLGDNAGPVLVYNNTYTYQGSLTWSHGAHNVKAGVALLRRQLAVQSSVSPRGAYSLNGTYSGSSLADLVAGIASNVQHQAILVFPTFYSWEPSIFAQDDWRATNWLTINMGVRYDIFTPFTEKHGQISDFDMAKGIIVSPSLLGANRGSKTANITTDFLDIAPRLGFSASLPRGYVVRGGFGMSFFPIQLGSNARLNNPPFTWSSSCGQSYAACPAGMNLPAAQYLPTTVANQAIIMANGTQLPYMDASTATSPSATLEIDGMQNDLKSGYEEQFALQVQKQFGANLVNLGYVGNLGYRQPVVPNVNQAAYATYNHSATCNGTTNFASSCYTQGPTPYASTMPSTVQIYTQSSIANSNYHSFQASAQRTVATDLTATFNYTWSHELNNGSPQGEGGTRAVECVHDNCLMDAGDGTAKTVSWRQYDYGNGDMDIRHRFSVMLNYTLPFGKTTTGLLAMMIKDWHANAATAWNTGQTANVGQNGATNISGIYGFRGGDAPNQVGNPYAGASGLNHFVMATAFANQTPGLLGNVHRNSIFGPHQRHLDFSVSKDFAVYESVKAQFRFEAFNITNTPNFATPNVSYGSAAFGSITATTTGSTPRQLQAALRFSF